MTYQSDSNNNHSCSTWNNPKVTNKVKQWYKKSQDSTAGISNNSSNSLGELKRLNIICTPGVNNNNNKFELKGRSPLD